MPTARGSKLWRFKCRSAGKVKLLAFGVYPAVSLAAARLRRAEAKVALGQGRGPGARNEPAAVTTFEQAARAWHTHRLAALDKRHGEQRSACINGDVMEGGTIRFVVDRSFDFEALNVTIAYVTAVEPRVSSS